MPNIFQRGATMLRNRLFMHASVPVVYLRGMTDLALKAVIGKSEFEQANEYGIAERTESVDFIVEADKLMLDGSRCEPIAGDQIEHVGDGNISFYEVMPFGSEPCFRYSDAPNNTILRIHTKKVEEM